MISLDMSRAGTQRKCQLKDYLSYQLKLEKKGKISPDQPFHHGTICHGAMEVLYHPDTWLDLDAAREAIKPIHKSIMAQDIYINETDHQIAWASLLVESRECLDNYYNHYVQVDKENFKPVGPEIPFRLLLADDVEFYGKIDGLVWYKGKIYILEFKFYATIEAELRHLDWDPQITDYSMVATSMFGEKFGGVLYRVTRKVLSKTLINFIEKEYHRSTDEMLACARFLVNQGRQMQALYADPLVPYNLVPVLDTYPQPWINTCCGCEFNNGLCKGYRTGGDWKSLISTEYQAKTRYADSVDDVLETIKEAVPLQIPAIAGGTDAS